MVAEWRRKWARVTPVPLHDLVYHVIHEGNVVLLGYTSTEALYAAALSSKSAIFWLRPATRAITSACSVDIVSDCHMTTSAHDTHV